MKIPAAGAGVLAMLALAHAGGCRRSSDDADRRPPLHVPPLDEPVPAPRALIGYHRLPHGGQMLGLDGEYVEILVGRDGDVHVYLIDRAFRVRPPRGVSGTLLLDLPGRPQVALHQVGDHLEGQGRPFAGRATGVKATLRIDGTATEPFVLRLQGGTPQRER